MSMIIRIWRKQKAVLLLLIFVRLLQSIVMYWLNQGYARLIDAVTANAFEQLYFIAISLFMAGACQVAVVFISSLLSTWMGENVGISLRKDALHGLLAAKGITGFNSGENLSKLNTDLSGVVTFVKNDFSSLLTDGIMMIASLMIMLMTNAQLTLIMLAVVPALGYTASRLSRPISVAVQAKNEAAAKYNRLVKSVIDSFPIVKIFIMQKELSIQAEQQNQFILSAEISANTSKAKLMSVNGFLSYLPQVILWGVGGYMVIRGQFSAGWLLAFINISKNAVDPLTNLPERISNIRVAMVNNERVVSMIEELNIYRQKQGGTTVDGSNKNQITFHNVSFAYEDENKLSNISLSIKKGQSTAIIGESGCGKSTLLQLIPGLFFSNKGKVSVFGTDVTMADLESLRKNIAYSPQDAQLFPTSIEQNITCGHDIAKETVLEACHNAQLDALISSLSNGVETVIGELGNTLSGGERQRISIARALAKHAPILILDEATSALDAQCEKAMLDHIFSLDITVILVTHKVDIAARCQQIICMHKGTIIETGTHDELIEKNGYYAKLQSLQKIREDIRDETA